MFEIDKIVTNMIYNSNLWRKWQIVYIFIKILKLCELRMVAVFTPRRQSICRNIVIKYSLLNNSVRQNGSISLQEGHNFHKSSNRNYFWSWSFRGIRKALVDKLFVKRSENITSKYIFNIYYNIGERLFLGSNISYCVRRKTA